jgi:hypothetical protein
MSYASLGKNMYSYDKIMDNFILVNGYPNALNDQLYHEIINLNLKDGENEVSEVIANKFISISFGIAYLYMITSWQWFSSAILLDKYSATSSQMLQLLYYSIFFSANSFLGLNQQGLFTVRTEEKNDTIKKERRFLRLYEHDSGSKCISVTAPGRGNGGQHEFVFKEFYKVFENWEEKNYFPGIEQFSDEHHFHSHFRNMFTYSLEYLSESLYEAPNLKNRDSVAEMISIWNEEGFHEDFFSEETWAIQYLSLTTKIQTGLIEISNKKLPFVEKTLLKNLIYHMKYNKIEEIITNAFKDILPDVLE